MKQLAAVIVLILLSACGSAPGEPPARAPSPSPAAVTATLCVRDVDEGNPLIVGWLRGQVAATFRHGPCVFDEASGRWLAIGPRGTGRFVTDGSSLAGSSRPRNLTIQAPDQQPIDVALPEWADDWAASGSQLAVAAGGGYVFVLVPELATVSADGKLTEAPIPAGYLVAAPTTEPNRYLLRLDDRNAAPQRMSGPHPSFLWRRGDVTPTSLPMLATQMEAAATPNLAWIRDDASGWWLIDSSGAATIGFRSPAPWDGQPDPTGQYAIEQTDRSQGCDRDSPPSCVVRLVDRSSGAVVAQVSAGSNSAFAWAAGTVVFSPTTDDPVAQPSAPDLVVLSPSGTRRIPLPPAR
jgi:hypothetical protein